MSWVLKFINKLADNLYYAVYVLLEGVFHTSKSWPTIISVAGVITLIINFFLISSVYDFCHNYNMPENTFMILDGLLVLLLYYGVYKYYLRKHLIIEKRYESDSLLLKIIYGIMALALIFFSLAFSIRDN